MSDCIVNTVTDTIIDCWSLLLVTKSPIDRLAVTINFIELLYIYTEVEKYLQFD